MKYVLLILALCVNSIWCFGEESADRLFRDFVNGKWIEPARDKLKDGETIVTIGRGWMMQDKSGNKYQKSFLVG